MKYFALVKKKHGHMYQFDIFDIDSGLIFFRFEDHRYKNISVALESEVYEDKWFKHIQCTPEWELHKELLPSILCELSGEVKYEYNILLNVRTRKIREDKLNEILTNQLT
jgi:hypothetical protein